MPVTVNAIDVWDELATVLANANGDDVTYTYDLTSSNVILGNPPRDFQPPASPVVYVEPPKGTTTEGGEAADIGSFERTWRYRIVGFVYAGAAVSNTSEERGKAALRLAHDIHTAIETDRGLNDKVIRIVLESHGVEDFDQVTSNGIGCAVVDAVITVHQTVGI